MAHPAAIDRRGPVLGRVPLPAAIFLLALLCCHLAHAGTVYVARRSWHVDVGIAVAELDPGLQVIARRFPKARYLFFGFGDRRYLTAPRHGSGNLSAAALPGAGLILVTAIDSSPEQGFGSPHIQTLTVTDAQSEKLESKIAAAFDMGIDGPKILEPGPYDESLYVEALPRYSVLHTCNTWAAEVLQQTGLPVSSRGVIFAGQVWSRVKRARSGMREP